MKSLPWGGSEELWSLTALRLLKRGYEVSVNYQRWPARRRPSRLSRVQRRGGEIHHRDPVPGLRRVLRAVFPRLRALGADVYEHRRWLRRAAPDFVLVSSGGFQAFPVAAQTCRACGVPYALLVHNADPFAWIPDERAEAYRQVYQDAEQCFFVSERNREVAELNTRTVLDESRVIDNPILVDAEVRPWPSDRLWRLACVGRLRFAIKAQDLILRVLRREKWRRRPVEVAFYGQDHGNGKQLRALVQHYRLSGKVDFPGYVPREHIWEESHALLLPSRFEGMPMVTLEAMLCGRVPIVTRCGRNGALVDDEETGFLAEAPTADLLDEAMERAWQRREKWEAMGREAARRVRERYSATPVEDFANALEHLAVRAPS